jgi:uncharacterized protein (TIGR02145 family)
MFPVAAQETLTDTRDGKTYTTVTIGGKAWMAENLNYRPSSGNSWCYNDSASYCKKYGRLYDWNTARTACPSGWHLSTAHEWDSLGQAVGGEMWWPEETGRFWGGTGKKLKAKNGWKDDYFANGNGDDNYGFSALPGGYRYNDRGSGGVAARVGFGNSENDGYWWTAAEIDGNSAYAVGMFYFPGELFDVRNYPKRTGCSIRCVKDDE